MLDGLHPEEHEKSIIEGIADETPPSHRPGGTPAPLEKLAKISSPVEIYTPIFVPAEND